MLRLIQQFRLHHQRVVASACQHRRRLASSDVHPIGVSIEFLRLFQATHSAIPSFATLTTTDVCNKIVIPTTKASVSAYVDAFRHKRDTNGRLYVAPANVFVSHAWKYKLSESIDAMEQYHQSHPDSYFWFDLFITNQNEATDLPHEWWSTTFRDSIRKIGSVLLVLSPWNHPVPMTRAWCLWEIMCALDSSHVAFAVQFPTPQILAFKDGVLADPNSIVDALVEIQAEKAEAFKLSDREMIFSAIRNTIGFDIVNHTVKQRLRAWYISTLTALASSSHSCPEQQARLLHQIAFALRELGAFDQSVLLFNQAVAIKESLLGAEHNSTVDSVYELGMTQRSLGEYNQAILCFQAALSHRLRTLGENHPATADCFNALGGTHFKLNNNDLALHFYNRALDIRLNELDANSIDTATSFVNIGAVFDQIGRYEEAVVQIQKALDIFTLSGGSQHPNVATCLTFQAHPLARTGQIKQAVSNCKTALDIFKSALGHRHFRVAQAHAALAAVNSIQGDHCSAILEYEKALEIFASSQGRTHKNTLDLQTKLNQERLKLKL